MPEDALVAHPRLPVWKTVGSCYRALWNRQVAQMPFIWVIVALGIINTWISYKVFGLVPTSDKIRSSAIQDPLFKCFYIGLFLETCALLSLIVSWVRYIVRGERPSGLYLGWAFWKFLVITLFYLILLCIFIVFGNLIIRQFEVYFPRTTNHAHLNPTVSTAAIIVIVCIMFLLYIKVSCVIISDFFTATSLSIKLFISNIGQVVFSLLFVLLPSLLLHLNTIHILDLLQEIGYEKVDLTIQVSLLFGALGTVFYIYQAIAFATHMGITYRTLVGHHLYASQIPSITPENKE